MTDASGAATNVNSYDEYGRPASTNAGRFQYTGQTWLAEASLYHYKARAYSPALGRFMQTDPVLWTGGPNLYAYVENDPINFVDPHGLCAGPNADGGGSSGCIDDADAIIVWGVRRPPSEFGIFYLFDRLREVFEPKANAIGDAASNGVHDVREKVIGCTVIGVQVGFSAGSFDAHGGGFYDNGTGEYGTLGTAGGAGSSSSRPSVTARGFAAQSRGALEGNSVGMSGTAGIITGGVNYAPGIASPAWSAFLGVSTPNLELSGGGSRTTMQTRGQIAEPLPGCESEGQ